MKPFLVFAHVPPPHHGQSYMVAQLLEALRARPEAVRVFHIDCRVSDDLRQVGRPGLRKILRLLGYCARALALRWRHGPMLFYYVPAPGKRAAVWRDWLVMALCRPFFRGGLVLHWHALGLAEWTERRAHPIERWLTRRLLGGADLSLVLAREVAVPEQTVLQPRRVRVLPNGIPDPCPDFDNPRTGPAAARRTRAGTQPRTGWFHVLFLAHCTREKGLYDALEAVALANRSLADTGTAVRCRLTVAGQFLSPAEQAAFERAAAPQGEAIVLVGFAAGAEKDRLFRESDCFLFPTWYPNEVMPVTLLEALAYGLPVVATRWRAIPETLPDPAGPEGQGACWLTEPRRPETTAAALRAALLGTAPDAGERLRRHFLAHYERGAFARGFLAALAELPG